jgi:hypothetical protein
MAYEGYQVVLPGLSAGADLSTCQYLSVYLSTNNEVNVATSSAQVPIGILQNKPLSGQAAAVCAMGITKVLAGATLAFTNFIKHTTTGAAITFNPALASTVGTTFGIGQVIDGCSTGEYATVFINCAAPMYYKATA